MWRCPRCNFSNDSRSDLCGRCGSAQNGELDPGLAARPRLRRNVIRFALCLPILYVASYFLLGSHTTGNSFVLGYPTSKRFTYHDRGFPFDPWIYQPLAWAEYCLRGERSQIVIEDGRYRGGQPIYAYGPFK